MPEAVRLVCSRGGSPRGGVLALQNLSCIAQVCFHLAGIAGPGLCLSHLDVDDHGGEGYSSSSTRLFVAQDR